jgi:hypothetical protein
LVDISAKLSEKYHLTPQASRFNAPQYSQHTLQSYPILVRPVQFMAKIHEILTCLRGVLLLTSIPSSAQKLHPDSQPVVVLSKWHRAQGSMAASSQPFSMALPRFDTTARRSYNTAVAFCPQLEGVSACHAFLVFLPYAW